MNHVALLSSVRDMDPTTIYTRDAGNGITMRGGSRWGSKTQEVFAYEFQGETYTPEAALAYLEDRKIGHVEFRAAEAKAKDDGLVAIEFEAAKLGKWRPHVVDAQGNPVPGEIEFTRAMFEDLVGSFKSGQVPNKLTHADDQAAAREMFDDSDAPMGRLASLAVKGDVLVATARVPRAFAEAIKSGLLVQRSIEATKRAGKWVLDAVAWLKNTQPAVTGMAEAQVGAALFAQAVLRDVDATPAPGTPGSEGGEDNGQRVAAGDGQAAADDGSESDQKLKEKTKMSDELKAANEKLLASYRALAARQVDGMVGRKLLPAQAEEAKKLLAAQTTTEAIDAQLAFLASGSDLPPMTGRVGDSTPPATPPVKGRSDAAIRLDELADIEKRVAASERSPEHRALIETDGEARLMAAARVLSRERGMDFGAAVIEASLQMPQETGEYLIHANRATEGVREYHATHFAAADAEGGAK